jgi:branched-chain amino acid transport system permease protein
MEPRRVRDLHIDIWGVASIALFMLVPLLSTSPLSLSLGHQIVIGITAALAVYIMEKMNLLAFTVPAFMAIGGYAAAMLATNGITNLPLLMLAALVVPMLAAIPIGVLVLRLKGVYFIFFTFILNEALQVAVFETPGLTGGSNGIAGVPPATFFGISFSTLPLLTFVTVLTGVVAAILTLLVTHRFRAEFSAIQENETLAESLGVTIWKYRTIGFIASAGISGLAGFALVHMLSTAHPSSFTSMSAVQYVAYAFVGGKGTILGSVVGATLMVWMSNFFSSQGMLSSALFGLLLMGAVMAAPEGIVGEIRKRIEKIRLRKMREGK